MGDKFKKWIDIASDTSGSAIGALAGMGIGSVIAGPLGAVGGALAGTAVEKTFQWIGNEIKERCLSKHENTRIGNVYECAYKKIHENLQHGKKLRTDDFYSETLDNRSSSEEILEATLLTAQKECEEKKLPYLANLYANINFDSTINREMANQLIKVASDLSYRQLVILYVIGAYQTHSNLIPFRRNKPFNNINGYEKISIATEIYDLYRKGIVYTDNVILGVANINPSQLTINGIGALIYNLMELSAMTLNPVAEEVIAFLSDTSS